MAETFYARLKPMVRIEQTFESRLYCAVPADWLVVVTDIEGSTAAIEAGKQKSVNFCGAAAIAALKNLCQPDIIPFQFGGDGAVILVPPHHAVSARVVLARTRRFVLEEYGLRLRVGAATVGQLHRRGLKIKVGRHEPSAGNSFAVFQGDAVDRLEAAIKGRGDPGLHDAAQIDPGLDDGELPDFTGLSCRWSPLPSTRGRMVALIVQGEFDHAGLYADLQRLAELSELKAVRRENLISRWPPRDFMLEAKAIRGRRPLFVAAIQVLLVSFLALTLIRFGIRLGGFDPATYIRGLIVNTDFPKRDHTVALVFDCGEAQLAAVRGYLDGRAVAGELQYGLQVSGEALMTCLVTNLAEDRHVHFVDGGAGGYTLASKQLKAKLNAAAAGVQGVTTVGQG